MFVHWLQRGWVVVNLRLFIRPILRVPLNKKQPLNTKTRGLTGEVAIYIYYFKG